MTDNPSKNGTAQVVEFPVGDEEKARRFHAEVVRMAAQPEGYWLFLISTDHIQKFGATKEQFEQAIRAVLAEQEKRAREDRGELRRREDRAERQRTKEKEGERKEERRERTEERKRQEREEREARKEAEREEARRKKCEVVFAEIADLPKLTHETRLKEAAARLGEDLELLAEEFEVFLAARTIPEDLEPWPEPVDTAELLGAIEAKFRRDVVATDAIVTASTLWAVFTYVVEIATHAPKLVFTFPERDAGKSLAQDVLRWMVLRPYAAVEATGAATYRIIDRLRPTLLLDEADTIFARRNVLAHIINASWSNSGRKVPRAGKGGGIEEFDVYGAQLISMKGLVLPDTTLSRCIVCMIWPKLATELVEEFAYQDDEEFKLIRRKQARWAVDNAVALRDAKPDFPPGFNNRVRVNWRMPLAIADLAGGEWSKRGRNAALELETDRDEPSEAIRLFEALRDIWGKAEERTSESLCKALAEYPSGEYADFRGKGLISQHQLAALLRPFGIRPIHNLHPTGRAKENRGGYRRAQFENAWARLLQKPSQDSLTRSPDRPPGGSSGRKK
jgi:putative DNA primase/helicase